MLPAAEGDVGVGVRATTKSSESADGGAILVFREREAVLAGASRERSALSAVVERLPDGIGTAEGGRSAMVTWRSMISQRLFGAALQ